MLRDDLTRRLSCFTLICLVAAMGILVLGTTFAGAAYPERPIKMIVPWAAGGDTDAIFRVIAHSMEKSLGKPVVIVNITGASGTVGAREAMKAPPDGYTIFAIHDFIHSTYYTGVAEMTYKDFEPVSLMTATPSILGAYGKAPWNTLKELLDDAKKRPEQITVGATLGSTAHFFPAMVALATGVKWKYVSYEGTAPRMTALLGGHVLLGDQVETNYIRAVMTDADWTLFFTRPWSGVMMALAVLSFGYSLWQRRRAAKRAGAAVEEAEPDVDM